MASHLRTGNQELGVCSWLRGDNPLLKHTALVSDQSNSGNCSNITQRSSNSWCKMLPQQQGTAASIQGLSFYSGNCCKGQAHSRGSTDLPLLLDLNVKAKRLAAREPAPKISRELGGHGLLRAVRELLPGVSSPNTAMWPCKGSHCSICWELSEFRSLQ